MLSCDTNYLVEVPEITVYMNCDTCLAVNLGMFELTEHDEFIFTIKNFDYTDSSCVFVFKARKLEMDDNGEVIFNIEPEVSKKIKQGAFYNLAVFENAFDQSTLTTFRKLSTNGKINIEYGAQDLTLPIPEPIQQQFGDISAARLEATDTARVDLITDAIIGVSIDKSKHSN